MSERTLSLGERKALLERGFVVVPGPVPAARLAEVYDAAVRDADARDVHIGRTTTRVNGLVNQRPEFDAVFLHAPLLAACELVLDQGFRLSSLHARTLRPHTRALGLHVDVARNAPDAPLLAFLVMVDDFHEDNGATRFVAGSHRAPERSGASAEVDEGEPALGAAGSMIVYDGSILHGHGTNRTAEPRRSIQGAFVHRGARAATDFAAGMRLETAARLTPLARQLLGL